MSSEHIPLSKSRKCARGESGATLEAHMKAAVLEQVNQPMVVKDIPMPAIGKRDALIKVAACGVCHTDLHLAEGFFRPLGIDVFPIVPGHEAVGTVEEVGAEVTHLKR